MITTVKNADIAEALKETTRLYLVGDLARPQDFPFLRDERLEIGISNYPDFQSEPTHVHDVATEFQYVICGWTEYMDVETGAVYEFKKGDVYIIHPGTAYAQRVKAGTRILFVKVPSINDKHLVEIHGEQLEWLQEKMRTVRTDYYHQDDAPEANSIRPAAAVAILNQRGELLMLHRRDNKKWTMPGGTLEFGESMTACALREVREESGLDVKLEGIIGTYTDPGIRVAYSDGEVRQEFSIVYYGTASNYDVTLDEESSQYRWVPLESVLELPLADSQRRRLVDVLEYLKSGKQSFC